MNHSTIYQLQHYTNIFFSVNKFPIDVISSQNFEQLSEKQAQKCIENLEIHYIKKLIRGLEENVYNNV